MKKYMIIYLLLFAGVCASFAQKKSVNEAKNLATQEKPDYKTAETLIKEALINDETKNDAKTWYTAGFIFNKKYEDERNKKIINSKFDEKMMYSSLRQAFDYWKSCLVFDKTPDAKGKVKPKFEKEIIGKVKENYSELINAGDYFFKKKDYKSSYEYLNLFIEMASSEDFKSANIIQDQNAKIIPFFASQSALNMKNDNIAIKALEIAKKTDYERYVIYVQLCEIYKKNNKDKYIETLKEGNTLYSDSIFFTANLINNYIALKDFNNASKFLLDAIKKKPNENLYIALGEVYQEAGKPEEIVKSTFEEAIKLNAKSAQSYYYIGRIYFNKAVESSNSSSNIKDNKKYAAAQQKTKALFGEALPYFKKANEIDPESMEYLIPLRSIYYNLNMNKEFDVVDKKISEKQKK